MASANAHKAFEIAQILTDHEIQPRPDSLGEIVEDQETLEGNARLKASAVCAEARSPAVADDTGLEVDACRATRSTMPALLETLLPTQKTCQSY